MSLGDVSFTENREEGYYSSREYDGNSEASRSISLSTGKTIDNVYVDNSGLGKNVGLHTLAYNSDALGTDYKLVSYAGVNYIAGNDGYVYTPDNISINGDQSAIDVTKNQLIEITQRAITLGNESGNITYGDTSETVQLNNNPSAMSGSLVSGEYVESCVVGEYVQFETNAGNEEAFSYVSVVVKDSDGNDVTANYDITYAEGKAVVKQRIVAGSLSVQDLIYSNSEKTAVFTAAEGMGLFNGDVVEITYSGDRQNVTAEGFTAVATVPVYDGSNSNYTFESGASISETFTISPCRVTISANEEAVKEYEYSGVVPNEVLLTLFNVPEGLDGEKLFLNFEAFIGGEPATVQYAGTYTVTATLADTYQNEEGETVNQANYIADSCDATITIKAKEINVSLSDAANSKIYDGVSVGDDYLQTLFVVEGEVAEGHVAELEITVAEGEIKNAGNYNITVALPSYYDKMYAVSSASVTSMTYTVEQVVIDGEIIAPEDSVYDGTEKYATFVFAEGSGMVGNDEVILNYATAGGQATSQVVSAGTYEVSATLPAFDAEGNSNYKWANEEIAKKNIVISPATVVITANSATAEKIYDEIEFTDYASLFTAPKAVDGNRDLILTYSVSGAANEILNAGTYTVTAMLADEDSNVNYTAEAVSVTYTVKPKEVSIEWTGASTVVFSGSVYEPAFTADGFIGEYAIAVTYEAAEGSALTDGKAKNAGNYIVTASLTDGNYKFADGVETSFGFTIEKVHISIEEKLENNTMKIEYGGSYAWSTIDFYGDAVINSEVFEFYWVWSMQDDISGLSEADAGTIYKAAVEGHVRYKGGDEVSIEEKDNFETIEGIDIVVFVEVVPKQIAVTATDASSEYNGKYVEYNTLFAMFGLSDGSGVYLTVNGENYYDTEIVNAGEYTVAINVTSENYQLVGTSEATYTVKEKELAVVWGNTEFIYNGDAQKPTATVETGIDGETVALIVAGAQTNAGSGYAATATMSVPNANFVLTNDTTTFNIAKAAINPTVTVKDWTFANYTEESAPVIADNPSDGAVTYVYSGTPNDGSEFSGTSEIPTLAGNYMLTVTVAEGTNYLEATCSTTFTVGKATVLTPVIEAKAYTGETLVADVDESPFYTVTKNEGGINVGQYDVELTLTDSNNYKWSDTENATTVVKFSIVNEINEWIVNPTIDGWIYGQIAKAPVYEAKLGNENAVIEYRPESADDSAYSSEVPTQAGNYYVRITIPGTEEYGVLESGAIAFTIAKADYDMSGVTFEDKTVTYNGRTQTIEISGMLPTGNDGVQVTVTYSAGIKNVGNAVVTATFATESGNYNVPEAMTATLTVDPKELTFTGYKAVGRDYTGDKTITLTGGSLNGVIDEDSVTYAYRGEMENADAGENKIVNVYVELTGDDKDNYTVAQPATTTVNITPAKLIVVWGETVFDYDGSEHAPTATAIGAVYGESVTLIVTGGAIDAGRHIATAEMAVPNGNYTLDSCTTEFVINQIESVIDVTGVETEYTYTGNLQTVNSGATLNHSEATLVYSNNTFTTVAEGNNMVVTISVAETTNYYAASVTVTISVAKADYDMSGITFEDKTVTYDGKTRTIEIDGTLPAGADGIQVTVSYSEGIKNVGSSVITATFATESGNYNVPSDMTATLTVQTKEVTASGIEAVDRIYDGTTGIEVSGGVLNGVVAGDEVILEVTGAFVGDKNVGENKTVTVVANISGADSGNYTLAVIEGVTADISAKQIAVVWSNTEFTYDGTAKQPVASAETGIDGETVELIVNGAQTEPGTYTATASVNNKNYILTNASVEFTIVSNEVIAQFTVGYGEITVAVEGGNKGVQYKVDNGAWTDLSEDGKISVELAASWSISLRYEGQSSSTPHTVFTSADNVVMYLENNLKSEAIENKDVIATAKTWLETAIGDKTEATAKIAEAETAYEAAKNELSASVENAFKATANMTSRTVVAAVAIATAVSGLGLAAGIIAIRRKGGKKNENE